MGAGRSEPLRRVSRLVLSFLELQVPMVLGAFVCYLLGRVISGSSSLATTYRPGTYVFAIGDVLFLTVPVVTWMLFRGRGGRYSLEMALAMLAPVAVIALVGELAGHPYLLWLVSGMYPAMSLGMTALLVYRRDRFSDRRRDLLDRVTVDGHGEHAVAIRRTTTDDGVNRSDAVSEWLRR